MILVCPDDIPTVWLRGELKTPPFSQAARLEAGYLLRRLHKGDVLSLPQSRPMPGIGPRCHELRINDEDVTWRIIYRADEDALVVVDVFGKKRAKTPKRVLEVCRKRLRMYDDA